DKLSVAFPNCNWPFGFGRINTDKDTAPCVHLHESWINERPGPGQTFSKGQSVYWNVVAFRAGAAEESPDPPSIDAPINTLNNENIRRFPEHDLVLWVESIADSRQCHPKADGTLAEVDNSSRPCRVFPQGLFLSPR